ncbi:hypothetical protein Q4503_09390 [Colwellia sp. 6_MG-2023]|uniref:hypothetical protein n=1 Tax=Colwellia sp. 6_MG-2023 TaxID=3062676 RepID=UPI0026E1145B|nr:hypothetical protein [Colwellia sp. 6_MG-2023]MDO6487912.1 hypothetical protein [Colwellia sp. 6_MG-2023]
MLSNPFKYSEKPQFCRFFRSLSESKRQKIYRNTSVHIFVEEIHLGIMPIGGRSRSHPDFSINITGDVKNKEKAKELLNSLASNNRLSTNELVCDAVDNIVKSMLYSGKAYYEITQDTPDFLKLDNFTSDKLVNIFGLYFQFVPEKDRKMWKKKLVVKVSNSIWKIEIPKELGGSSGYRKLIHSLGNNTEMYPKCYDIEKIVTQSSDFNFNEYINQTKVYQYRLLELWGGNLRHTSTEYANEYYLIHRIVRFNRAQAILREHVINQLNILLNRKKIKSIIEVKGLPTVQSIDEQLKKLEEGEAKFVEIINTTRVS